MSGTFTQMFPPAPSFTEKELGDLTGKLAIVTGGSSGVGFELAKILYSNGCSVYIAARSPDKINLAIETIQGQVPKSNGKLSPLTLDLADLSSIKKSADDFLGKEARLDVLIHNAGIMTPPAGSKTSLGHDLEMSTNCLGPFLFNHYLEGLLKQTATAATATPGSVRIVWLASLVNIGTPTGGIVFDEETKGPKVLKNAMENYMESKVGNIFLSSITAQRLSNEGIISLCVNPGLMKTELQRHGPAIQGVIMRTLFKCPRYGAYSELYAAFSPSVTVKDSGRFIIPWGRFGVLPEHIAKGLEPESQGGTGASQKFWDWCERETKSFM